MDKMKLFKHYSTRKIPKNMYIIIHKDLFLLAYSEKIYIHKFIKVHNNFIHFILLFITK